MEKYKLAGHKDIKKIMDKHYKLRKSYSTEQGLEDLLTTLFNKNYFELYKNIISLEMQRGLMENIKLGNNKQTWAVLFCDIDGLKLANDNVNIGHMKADSGIKAIASIIKECIRTNRDEADKDSLIMAQPVTDDQKPNIPIRFGGDEFLIILPNCTTEKAGLVRDRIKYRIAQNLDKTANMTLSIGIADTKEVEMPTNVDTPESTLTLLNNLIYLAEQRMYKDKNKNIEKLSYEEKKKLVYKHLNRLAGQVGFDINNSNSIDLLIDILGDIKNDIKENKK